MISKNRLYERLRDNMEVVTLESERDDPRHVCYTSAQKPFIAVRYVKSGRKGYVKREDLDDRSMWTPMGVVDPTKIWETSPLKATRTPDNLATAAAEADLRELQIKKLRDQCLNGPLYAHQASQNAKGALEQAIHMILAGV